jgi:preprotein translocase subunit YajC
MKLVLLLSVYLIPLMSLAQDKGGAPAGQPPGMGGMMVPLILTFVIMYFLMIRPQQKKQKEHQKTLSELKPGEQVVTNSGIFGKIHMITDRVITLEVANNVRIKILKNQVAGRAETEQAGA